MAESDSELGPLSMVSQEHSEIEPATKTEDSLPHGYAPGLSQAYMGGGVGLEVARNYIDEGNIDEEETSDERDASGVGPGGMAGVVVWLQSLGLDQYRQIFEDDGFDSVDAVRAIQESDLVAMGVKTGHIRLIMKNLPPAPSTHDLVTKVKPAQRKPYAPRAPYLASIPYKLPIPTNPNPNSMRGYPPTHGMVVYGQRGPLPLPPRPSEAFAQHIPQAYVRPVLVAPPQSPPKRPRGRPRKPTLVVGPPTTASNMYYSPYTQPVYMAPPPASAPTTAGSPTPTNQTESTDTGTSSMPLATPSNGMQAGATSPGSNTQQVPTQTPARYSGWRQQVSTKPRPRTLLSVEPKPQHMGTEGAGFRLFSQVTYDASGEPIKRKRGRPRKYPLTVTAWNEQHTDQNGNVLPPPQLLGQHTHTGGGEEPGGMDAGEGEGEEEEAHNTSLPTAIGEAGVYPDSEITVNTTMGEGAGRDENGVQHEPGFEQHQHEHEHEQSLESQLIPNREHQEDIMPSQLSLGTVSVTALPQ